MMAPPCCRYSDGDAPGGDLVAEVFEHPELGIHRIFEICAVIPLPWDLYECPRGRGRVNHLPMGPRELSLKC